MSNKTYVLLVGATPQELNKTVNHHLKAGWDLQGIHQVTTTLVNAPGHPLEGSFVSTFTQAMTLS